MLEIVKTNQQRLYNLTQEQRRALKDKLTYDNPAYNNAKRYSRCKHITISPYLLYYKETSVRGEDGCRHKVLSVPIGVNVPEILQCKYSVDDHRVTNEVHYPPFVLDLRKDQVSAADSYLKEYEKKEYPRSLIQLPTGKGKSILALYLAYVLSQKTLILVHKDDLVTGWKKDIELCFKGKVEVGLIKAKSRKVGKQITIATVQTLSRMSLEELETFTNQFGFVVQDECHHVGLNIFNIIDSFNSFYKLGLSATPKRADRLNFVFDLFFGGLCYKYVYDSEDTDITQVKVIPRKSPFKYRPFLYDGMVYNYHDFDSKELPDDIEFLDCMDFKDRPTIPFLVVDNEMVLNRKYKIFVCKDIISEYRKGHSCIALFTQKEHINSYYKYLCRYIPKDQIMLYYGDSKESSEDLMKKAENKEVLVTLATYAKATEGTNVKSWEVEFLVSSMNNEKNVEQATGRIRRTKEGKLNPVLVYDYYCMDSYSISNHYNTRRRVYKRLKYQIDGDEDTSNRSLFTRGYRK